MKFKSSIQPYKLTETGGIPLTNSVPETIDNITERIVSTYNCGKYKDQIRTILERTSEVWNRTLNLRVKDLMEVAESKECEQVLTFEPSFCDSLFFLRPEHSVKIFETLDFNNLKLKENATPRLFSPSFQSIPFYTISELTDLVGNFKSFYEENKKPLIKFGYPKFHSINSVWLESLLGRLYFTKLPICMRINPEPSSEDFSYTWGDSSPLNGRVIWHKETPLLVYPSEYEKDFKILGLCDYEDAPDIDYLSDDQIQILKNGRGSYYRMTINIFDAIYACMQSQEKSKDIWENCLNIIKSRLTRKEMNFYFQIDRVFDKLKIHDYLHLLYERYSLVDKWFGITNLISLIGHCEKEIQIGTYDKTKSEYLQVPENLRSHIEGKIYTSYYEVLDSQIDKVLETFLDLNNQENQFWEEFENRVNDAFEVELSDEIFRTIQISLPLETDTISTPRKPINLSEEQMRDCNIREYKVAPKYQSTMVIEIPGTDSRKKSRYIQIHGESRKIGDSLFPLLLVFVIELKKGEGDWIHLEDLAKKKKVIGNDAEYQKVGRLRDVLGVNLLENDGSGNYRISTHPDFVGYNKKKLLTSRDEWISDLANELP